MRKLFLLRGLPGSGKSTWIKDNNLESYTLSSDKLREMYSGLEYDINGNYYISQKFDKMVWESLHSMLEMRMKRRLTTFVDATSIKEKTLNKYLSFAIRYSYNVYIVDFTNIPVEICIKQNKNRGYKTVPESVIFSMNESLKNAKIPKDITVITPDECIALLKGEVIDGLSYKKITFIGDIHGCLNTLKTVFQDEVSNDTLYVFTGDYIDRGPNSVETVLYLADLSKFKNFIFIEGNHERWLRAWIKGHNEDIRSREFIDVTAKQFDCYFKSHPGLDKIQKFVDSLKEYAYIKINDKYGEHGKIFACHGGVPNICENIELESSENIIRGVGKYEDCDNVDNKFLELFKNNSVYQVHGHRNFYNSPIQVNERVFNLEGAVERGGCLRTVTFIFDQTSFDVPLSRIEVKEYKNKEEIF